MTTFSRRGVCPALSAPMQTGDGLLVRLNPIDGEIAPKALIGLCQSALRHGNGIIEVTARGSIQIRGLTADSAAALADEVDALGITVRTGVPVDASPLAGIDPMEVTDPRPLAEAIREAISETGLALRLGPKVSVVVDGRGQIGLGTIMADVRLVAVDASRWRLSVGGVESAARLVGEFEADAACAATLALLHAVAALGRAGRARDLALEAVFAAIEGSERSHSFRPPSVLPDISPTRGESSLHVDSSQSRTIAQADAGVDASPAAEVEPSVTGRAQPTPLPISPLVGEMSGRTEGGGTELDLATLGLPEMLANAVYDTKSQPTAPTNSSPIGILPLAASRHALGIALPFGSIRAETLIAFCESGIERGASGIRPAPARTLLFVGLTPAKCTELQSVAGELGFVTAPTDPRPRIAACPGAPACASGMIAARDVAAEIAQTIGPDLDYTLTLHVSGCAKGCAHPGPAALTIVGDEKGAAFVVGGTAKGLPATYTAGYEAARGVQRLARLLATERQPHEDATACLARLGAKRLAQTLVQG